MVGGAQSVLCPMVSGAVVLEGGAPTGFRGEDRSRSGRAQPREYHVSLAFRLR